MLTLRRYYLDKKLLNASFIGKVLDIGGKKKNKRGKFRPPLDKVELWEYLNIDKTTDPDYCCSADNVPVPDNTFDVILLTEVIEHLQMPEQVLSESFRILKPGGKIIATIPFLYPIHADPYDFQRWTPEKIQMEFTKVGFKEINITSMGSLFAVIYDLLYVATGNASRNRNSLKIKLLRKVVMPFLAKIFMFLDKRYEYKGKWITTGFYVEAKK